VAENFISEEFLLDFNKSLELITSNQSSMNERLANLSSSIEDLSASSQDLNSAISEGFNPQEIFSGIPNLIDGINSLKNTVKDQGESADQSAKNLFSILNPVGAANTNRFLSSVPRFEEGGTMDNTGAAIIGERGPELVLLPENSQIFPLETNTFDQFEAYLNNIQPGKLMGNVLGSENVILARDEAGNIMVYPDLKANPASRFEPYNLNEKIQSQIESENQILNSPTTTSTEKEESNDVLSLLEAFTKNLLPSYQFREQESKEGEGVLVDVKSEIANQIEKLKSSAVETPGAEKTSPILEPISALAENVPNVLNKPGTPTPAEAIVEKAASSELSVIKEKLATLPPPPPVVAPPPPVQVQTVREVVTEVESTAGQNIKFPETFAVTITKYEEGERQFNELKQMLSDMYSVLSEMNTNERDINTIDSYPIRPVNTVF